MKDLVSENVEEQDVFVFPLSFAQQRLWFLEQLEPNSPEYTLCAAIRVEGAFDAAVLEACFGEVVRRHESLRTTFSIVI